MKPGSLDCEGGSSPQWRPWPGTRPDRLTPGNPIPPREATPPGPTRGPWQDTRRVTRERPSEKIILDRARPKTGGKVQLGVKTGGKTRKGPFGPLVFLDKSLF